MLSKILLAKIELLENKVKVLEFLSECPNKFQIVYDIYAKPFAIDYVKYGKIKRLPMNCQMNEYAHADGNNIIITNAHNKTQTTYEFDIDMECLIKLNENKMGE